MKYNPAQVNKPSFDFPIEIINIDGLTPEEIEAMVEQAAQITEVKNGCIQSLVEFGRVR